MQSVQAEKKQRLNDIALEMRKIEQAQARSEIAAKNLNSKNMSREMFLSMQKSLENSDNARLEQIKKLETERDDIISGKYDKTIENKHLELRRKADLSEAKQRKKRENLSKSLGERNRSIKRNKVKDTPKEVPKEVPKETPPVVQTVQLPINDVDEYINYRSILTSLPRYLKEKLRNMPANKGYVWRGCWFFGELPREKEVPQTDLLFFEKINDGLLRIHETTKTCYSVYEKVGKEKKTLLHSQNRKRSILPK